MQLLLQHYVITSCERAVQTISLFLVQQSVELRQCLHVCVCARAAVRPGPRGSQQLGSVGFYLQLAAATDASVAAITQACKHAHADA